nr:class I SAM-dependent methyltransferase [candidate division Zixibacteria bacterium]
MDKDRRKYFESCAEEWDKEFTAEDLEILSFLIDSFNIKEGSRIADLGCGTGIMFDMLRRKTGDNGIVVGIDFARSMIDLARRNFPFRNVFEVDGDVEHLPLRRGFFDHAITFAAFAHFVNHQIVMEEVSRILKPGGTFHIIHLMGSRELEEYHIKTGGPVAHDHLPSHEDMMALFQHGHFINIKIADQPGIFLASGVKG